MSGIPWWNTDIGGFQGGDPSYREVLIRWFPYGTFSPLIRLHGDRKPRQAFPCVRPGAGPVRGGSFRGLLAPRYPLIHRMHLKVIK